MKDDTGDQALTDEEGYEFKRIQVVEYLDAEDMLGVSVLFFNVEMNKATQVRKEIFGQRGQIRTTVSERLFNLCAAATEIIENHEQHAVTTAIEAVARRLNTFLRGNGTHMKKRYALCIDTLGGDTAQRGILWPQHHPSNRSWFRTRCTSPVSGLVLQD